MLLNLDALAILGNTIKLHTEMNPVRSGNQQIMGTALSTKGIK